MAAFDPKFPFRLARWQGISDVAGVPLMRISQITFSAAIGTAIGIACLFDPVTVRFGVIAIVVAGSGWVSAKLKEIVSHDAEPEEPDRWA